MEDHLLELCSQIVEDIDNCTYQDKKDAFAYLDLKVIATTEGADIKGYLDPAIVKPDLSLSIPEQSSGCLSTDEYDWAIPFAFSI